MRRLPLLAVLVAALLVPGQAAAAHAPRAHAAIVYPGFNPNSLAGDAALLVLATPTTAPAMAIATSSDAALETRGTSASIAGWGETFGGDPNPPTQLQTATTVMDSATDCRSQA